METREIDEKWIRISGIVDRGHQVASGMASDNPYPNGTIKMQIPFFKERGLDLGSFFQGTLNVSISPNSFEMKLPEYTFRKVAWTTLHPPEDFSFSRCKIIFDNVKYDSWIYYPHPETKIRHFQNPSLIEVIAPPIPKIEYGDQVEIEVNTEEILVNEP
jgi:hypothetical protein